MIELSFGVIIYVSAIPALNNFASLRKCGFLRDVNVEIQMGVSTIWKVLIRDLIAPSKFDMLLYNNFFFYSLKTKKNAQTLDLNIKSRFLWESRLLEIKNVYIHNWISFRLGIRLNYFILSLSFIYLRIIKSKMRVF